MRAEKSVHSAHRRVNLKLIGCKDGQWDLRDWEGQQGEDKYGYMVLQQHCPLNRGKNGAVATGGCEQERHFSLMGNSTRCSLLEVNV